MALTNGTRYWGKSIGANLTAGKPVLAVNDPCVAPASGARKIVRRVGTNLTAGKPVYAIKDCTTETPQVGSRYPAQRIGTNLTSGKPVFALRCQTCSCNTKIKVTGCLGLARQGATVTVGDSSGVTNAAGEVTLSIPGNGTYTVDVVAPGFANFSGSRALTCGGTITISLTPGTEQHCSTCVCSEALPETLYFTNLMGTCVLTWYPAYSKWAGCQSSGHSCATPGPDPDVIDPNCNAGDLKIFWLFNGCSMFIGGQFASIMGCAIDPGNPPRCFHAPPCGNGCADIIWPLLGLGGWVGPWHAEITYSCDPFQMTWTIPDSFPGTIECFGKTQVLSI